MVRWRVGLILALLLLLPTILGKNNEDDDDEERQDTEEDEEEDEDDDDEGVEERSRGEPMDQQGPSISARRAPILATKGPALEHDHDHEPEHEMVHGVTTGHLKRRPLECFVCAFKSENPLRACLDPTKFRVHTITCHSVDDRCFTSVISKGDSYEAVVRGCRSGCVGSAETTCCESNRCNNQAFAMPQPKQKSELRNYPVPLASKANRIFPPSVMFFVTILLILQTVSKVSCV